MALAHAVGDKVRGEHSAGQRLLRCVCDRQASVEREQTATLQTASLHQCGTRRGAHPDANRSATLPSSRVDLANPRKSGWNRCAVLESCRSVLGQPEVVAIPTPTELGQAINCVNVSVSGSEVVRRPADKLLNLKFEISDEVQRSSVAELRASA